MHPRIQELLDHLALCRAELRASVDTVPPELRGQHPAPARWSVAEVLEHLAIVEGRVTVLFTKQVAAARAAGLAAESETAPVVPTAPMRLLLDRTRPVTAPERSRPPGESDARAAWAALETTREGLRAALLSADGLALGSLSAPHPIFGELNLYQWIAVLGGHEARHAAQIREIGLVLAAPASGV